MAPAKPAKNISPLALTNPVPHPVKSFPGRPSATVYRLNVPFLGSNFDSPWFELIQRLPRLSSRTQVTVLLGRFSRSL
jgi:hypothetical protein